MDHPALVRAADWLESVQHSTGGWGESCLSYEDPAWMGVGEPTASQTAWALLGLVAAGRAESNTVRKGIRYLVESQLHDGSWEETPFTGTGFPRVFYLKYHLYRIYFPLMAVSRYRAAIAKSSRDLRPALACRIPAQPSAHEC
jgi:squalene-hopene/tetraprenyl-beta-curcumene cyclase